MGADEAWRACGGIVNRGRGAVEKREPKPCKCEPCRTCGMKHCCNLAVPHPGGWVRVVGEPYCPAPRERWSWK